MNSFKPDRRRRNTSSALTPPSTFGATTGHPAPTWQEQDMTGLHAGHSLADFTIHRPGEPQSAQPVTNTSIQKVDVIQSQGQSDKLEQAPSREHQENLTGLPDALKAGVESLSGYSLDDIRVHYNSAKPAEVQALAYTQGTNIHVGPGQERHLEHEAWHVVQQKQGRVQPTMQMKDVAINDDVGLEREADVIGKRVSQVGGGAGYRQKVSDTWSYTSNVIQLKPVPVGYDRIESGATREGEDTLITSGLGNCIAVVAYDRATKTAVMAHYNTGQGGSGRPPALTKLKSMLEQRLQDRRGGQEEIKPEFHIVLGSTYEKSEVFKEEEKMVQEAVIQVFGVEPQKYGYTVEFDIETGKINKHTDVSFERQRQQLGDEWSDKGEEIDYIDLNKAYLNVGNNNNNNDDET